jgi:ribosomal protein L22
MAVGYSGVMLRACVLLQAASNAKNNYGMRKARLVVSTAYCDMAPPLKRVRARAQGRCGAHLGTCLIKIAANLISWSAKISCVV